MTKKKQVPVPPRAPDEWIDKLLARPDMMSASEVAKVLGVSRSRVEQICPPTVRFSERTGRWSPGAVVAVIRGEAPQPTNYQGFLNMLSPLPMDDAAVGAFLSCPPSLVAWLDIPPMTQVQGEPARYDSCDIARWLEKRAT